MHCSRAGGCAAERSAPSGQRCTPGLCMIPPESTFWNPIMLLCGAAVAEWLSKLMVVWLWVSAPGMPPHRLCLKGCPVMLLRNFDPQNGHCNGSRYTIENLTPNLIDATLAVGLLAGKHLFIPRILDHSYGRAVSVLNSFLFISASRLLQTKLRVRHFSLSEYAPRMTSVVTDSFMLLWVVSVVVRTWRYLRKTVTSQTKRQH